MELDHRAAEAASHLHDQVVDDLDVDSAYGRVVAGVGARRARAAGVRLGVGVLVALVAVGALVTVASVADGPGEPHARDGLDDELALDGELDARGQQILGGLPDGPLDGRESWRLPVVADRSDGLSAGDAVTLYGKGFEPGELVGAVHCSSEADTAGAGVGACDLGDGFSNTISGHARFDGSVVITVPVRRHITTPEGAVDCASLPERCLLAIGAAENYDRSGGTYINFADAPPFPQPVATVDPAGPYTPGQQVVVHASSLMPARPYQVLQCVGAEHCASLSQGRSSVEGLYDGTVTLGSSVEVDGVTEACDDACTLVVTGIGLADATNAPFPDPIPIELLPGDAVVGSEPPVTAPVDPGTAQPPPTTATDEPPATTSTTPVDPSLPAATTTAPPATTAPTTTTTPGESTTTTTP